MAENRIYAYCRVSKNDETMTIENQTHTIELWAQENGVKIASYYKDKCKGDTPVEKRKQLPVLLENLREGDTVIVAEVFRLHRSQSGLAQLYRQIIEDKKANFITLNEKESILNTNQHDKLDVMQIGVRNIVLMCLSLCSELEKRNVSLRTKRALKERKDRGVVLGRPTVEIPERYNELYQKAVSGEISHVQAMKELGLKKTTYYEIAKKFKRHKVKLSNEFMKMMIHNKDTADIKKTLNLTEEQLQDNISEFQEIIKKIRSALMINGYHVLFDCSKQPHIKLKYGGPIEFFKKEFPFLKINNRDEYMKLLDYIRTEYSNTDSLEQGIKNCNLRTELKNKYK